MIKRQCDRCKITYDLDKRIFNWCKKKHLDKRPFDWCKITYHLDKRSFDGVK